MLIDRDIERYVVEATASVEQALEKLGQTRLQILFVVEVTRGGYSADEDQGDVLIDNVEITDYDAGTCKSECSCD